MSGRCHPGTRHGSRHRYAASRSVLAIRPPTLPRQGHPPRQRSCHGGCFPRAPHLSRAVLHPRYARARPAPSAPWSVMSNGLDTATRPATSPLRGSPDPRCRRPPPGLSCRVLVLEDSDGHAARQALRLFARATVIGDADGRSPLPQDPALSCLLREERAAVTPTPPAVSLSRPQFTVPRRSRAFHAAPAPRQALAQAGCRVSRVAASVVSSMARLLRVSDRLPTGSFGASRNTVIVTQPRDSSNRVAFLTRRLVPP